MFTPEIFKQWNEVHWYKCGWYMDCPPRSKRMCSKAWKGWCTRTWNRSTLGPPSPAPTHYVLSKCLLSTRRSEVGQFSSRDRPWCWAAHTQYITLRQVILTQNIQMNKKKNTNHLCGLHVTACGRGRIWTYERSVNVLLGRDHQSAP